MTAATVGIFHLVRHANGPEPFRAFLQSFRTYPPGGPHRLVLICKGFPDRAAAAPYLAEAADLDVDSVFVTDRGTDVHAYFQAVEARAFESVALFNSFCELVAPRWFEHFLVALQHPGIGVVGATGSLES